MVSTEDTWELYKENAAPLERGRNIEKLTRALGPKSSTTKLQRQEDDKNIRTFERLVRPSELFAGAYSDNRTQDQDEINAMLVKCKVDKDPIVHWLRYIKYHEETYPSDTHTQFLLKERCTQSLLYHPKYTNDVRFIRVCVLYADRTDDPQSQFKLFHKHKLGVNVAIFWLAWAWVAEKKKDFQFADKIFRKAIQKKAQPDKVVNERYKQFQRRMSRHWLNANANPQSVYDDEEEAPQSQRGVLSGLTEEGVRQNHRGRGANAIANRHQRGRINNEETSNNQRNNRNGVSAPEIEGGFEIFSDGNSPGQSPFDDENNGDIPLPLMVKEHDRKKENNLEAEAWNKRGGLNTQIDPVSDSDERRQLGASSVVSRWAGRGGDSIIAGGTSSQPAFQVFIDEECADKEDAGKPGNESKMKKRSLRQRMEEKREPLRIMGSSSGGPSGGPPGVPETLRPKRSLKPLQSKALKKSSDTEKTKSAKVPLGFNKSLVAKDKHGRERCFEQHRAKAYRFNSAPPVENFNLLHKVERQFSSSANSSMEVDDASTIEEVEMEDISRSMSMIREDENEEVSRFGHSVARHGISTSESGAKTTNEKKVLFGLDTSIVNRSSSRAHNTSTASSTVDERDAVGVVDDREETLNTKFAARELSMMFSSPAGLMNQSVLPTSKEAPDRLLFSIHQENDDSYASLDKPPLRVASKPNNNAGAFSIFCDGQDESKGELVKKGKSKKLPSAGFAIYEEDSESSLDEDAGHGDTASLADIMDIMKDSPTMSKKTKPKQLRSGGGFKSTSGNFAIFCDEENTGDNLGIDNGTVLTEDTAAFADLSFIPSNDGDTCNLQNKIDRMSIRDKH